MGTLSENAIILIGNGFDLAHKMRTPDPEREDHFISNEQMATSYSHFANHYLQNIILKKLINFELDTNLFSQKFLDNFNKLYSNTTSSTNISKEYKGFLLALVFFKTDRKLINHQNKITEYINNTSNLRNIISNEFLVKLYENKYDNWFDIEQAYFSELKRILNQRKKPHEKKEYIKILNKNLNEIKVALIDYLKTINPARNIGISLFFSKNFFEKNNAYIVNFNYTNTFSFYEDELKKQDIAYNINHIHGELKDQDIVFGYGDDTNIEYEQMKETGIDEYLENFKTNMYFDNFKYRELIQQIEEFNDYEVYVLGHSLGRTDKTILKEILDNEKCKNIHLFKRSDLNNEFAKNKELRKLQYNITRIISKDKVSRITVVPKDITNHFPFNDNFDNQLIEEKRYKLELHNAHNPH